MSDRESESRRPALAAARASSRIWRVLLLAAATWTVVSPLRDAVFAAVRRPERGFLALDAGSWPADVEERLQILREHRRRDDLDNGHTKPAGGRSDSTPAADTRSTTHEQRDERR